MRFIGNLILVILVVSLVSVPIVGVYYDFKPATEAQKLEIQQWYENGEITREDVWNALRYGRVRNCDYNQLKHDRLVRQEYKKLTAPKNTGE
jgi:hypothetical protein